MVNADTILVCSACRKIGIRNWPYRKVLSAAPILLSGTTLSLMENKLQSISVLHLIFFASSAVQDAKPAEQSAMDDTIRRSLITTLPFPIANAQAPTPPSLAPLTPQPAVICAITQSHVIHKKRRRASRHQPPSTAVRLLGERLASPPPPGAHRRHRHGKQRSRRPSPPRRRTVLLEQRVQPRRRRPASARRGAAAAGGHSR